LVVRDDRRGRRGRAKKMKPTTSRDETYEAVRAALPALRARVLDALEAAGRATGYEIAERTGLGILTVRPRLTELSQAGLIMACGRVRRGRISETIWRVASKEEWLQWKRNEGQLQLI
jgi:DNA-binding transcriptional ArsR family regulator